MKILKPATAGTLESSDIFVEVSPSEQQLILTVDSVVKSQFGASIEESIRDVLHQFSIDCGIVSVTDRGALDCTIRARIETAIMRATKEDINA